MDGKPDLKKDHLNGYFSQIQMGLSGAPFCDFMVYTLKGLKIARALLDNEYFINLIQKLNNFYRKCMLPKIIDNKKLAIIKRPSMYVSSNHCIYRLSTGVCQKNCSMFD